VFDAQTAAGLLEARLAFGVKCVAHGEDHVVVGHHRFDSVRYWLLAKGWRPEESMRKTRTLKEHKGATPTKKPQDPGSGTEPGAHGHESHITIRGLRLGQG